MEFKWRQTENKRRLLAEKNDIRALRISLLIKITYFQNHGNPIVFRRNIFSPWTRRIGPTVVHKGYLQTRIIQRFMHNCLLIFKSNMNSENHHSEMNSENYGK